LYLGSEVITIYNNNCDWLSNEVYKSNSIEVEKMSKVTITQEGVLVSKPTKDTNLSKPTQFVFPSNEFVIWMTDFYELLWQKKLKEKLVLLVKVSTRNLGGDLESVGYVVKEISDHQGKLIFGTFEEPLLKEPV
jgi:hypothetical protein